MHCHGRSRFVTDCALKISAYSRVVDCLATLCYCETLKNVTTTVCNSPNDLMSSSQNTLNSPSTPTHCDARSMPINSMLNATCYQPPLSLGLLHTMASVLSLKSTCLRLSTASTWLSLHSIMKCCVLSTAVLYEYIICHDDLQLHWALVGNIFPDLNPS